MKHLLRSTLFVFFLFIFSFSEDNAGSEWDSSIDLLSIDEKEQVRTLLLKDKHAELDSLMQNYHKRYRFHGNILVARNGLPFFHESYGLANQYNDKPLDTNHIFQVASISKQFTAMAIMILKERDLLSYNDTVNEYIHNIPYERITVKQLLNHTSGLPNYMWVLEHHWDKKQKPYNDDILRLMAEQDLPLYFRPGRRYDYSNTGYIYLAAIVEAVSGKKFPDFVRENIFKPLDMNNSFVYSAALDNDYPEKVDGYYRRWRRFYKIEESVHDGVVGDKNVYSTTGDLFKWDQALYTNKLVSKETLEEAFTPLKLRNRYEIPYGFGFRIKERYGNKVVYHNGLWEGFRLNFARYTDDRHTVILLNNTDIRINNYIARRLERILFKNDDIYTNTESLAMISLEESLGEALDHYYLMKEKTGDYKVNGEALKRAAKYLERIDHPEKAFRMNKLYEAVNGVEKEQLASKP
ncbi:MAG: beta-lactamase family protein [Bacteroidales bacterium]|nr:beta-lactamase family protein [Bacteroidales bacterium]